MKSSVSYLILLLIALLSLNFACSEIPEGSIVIPLAEYDSLKSGAIIKEVPIPPNYDSVNSFWGVKLTTEVAVFENEILTLNDTVTSLKFALAECNNKEIVNDTVFIGVENKPLVQLIPREVKVDTFSLSGGGDNLIDGLLYRSKVDRGTRWGSSGYPHWAIFNFNEVVTIDSIYINTFGWNEGYTHIITVFNYPDSISQFTTKEELFSGHFLGVKTKQLALRVDGGKNNWTDIGEIKFFGK